jgi:hypothetical protein
MDNRIDGVVLSVMNEIGSIAGNPDGVNGKPAKKAKGQKTKSGKLSQRK